MWRVEYRTGSGHGQMCRGVNTEQGLMKDRFECDASIDVHWKLMSSIVSLGLVKESAMH